MVKCWAAVVRSVGNREDSDPSDRDGVSLGGEVGQLLAGNGGHALVGAQHPSEILV
jgi:hypothetical protein